MRSKGLLLFAALILVVSCLVATMRITHKFSESFEVAKQAVTPLVKAPLVIASKIGTPQDQILKLKARVEMDSQTMDQLRKQIPTAQSNFGEVCSNILKNSVKPQPGVPMYVGAGMVYDGGAAQGASMMPQGAAQGAVMMPQGAAQGAIRG